MRRRRSKFMNASKPVTITLRMQDVRGLRLRATGIETLRALAGPDARPLGHDRGPDYAFLAVDATREYAGALRELTRSFVFLPALGALVTFDTAVSTNPLKWVLEGADNRENVATVRATESSS